MEEAVKRLLNYSFNDIDYNYDKLTGTEKGLITREEFDKLVVELKKPTVVKRSSGEMYLDTRYCDICDMDTTQECVDSNHERDSSDEYEKCLRCRGIYTGYTGKREVEKYG